MAMRKTREKPKRVKKRGNKTFPVPAGRPMARWLLSIPTSITSMPVMKTRRGSIRAELSTPERTEQALRPPFA